MPAPFTDADSSPYAPGSLFLGYSDTGKEIGIASERHFICIAGSGSGKGSSLIVPNLRRWNDNVLVIDPGGGNVRASWEAREAMGQEVHVIDPAHVSLKPDKFHPGIPRHLLKTFNPLAALNPRSRTYGEDIGVIADGMVMRHDPKHARWDNAGATILAGLIDFVRTNPEFEDRRTLIEVRNLITQHPDALTAMFEVMNAPTRNRASIAAASLALADLKDKDGGSLIENAQQNTQWLDYTSMSETLHESNFELSDIKTKPCTVFLVIHPDYMVEHGRFLRLFVRSALSIMAKGDEGDEAGRQCLFILDEFFSLGKMDAVQKAAGGMRKNGVQLLPILQDLGQLKILYDDDGAHTFFGNADAQIFFGNSDALTLEAISNQLGNVTAKEIGPAPSGSSGPGLGSFMINNMENRNTRMVVGASAAVFGGLLNALHNALAAEYQAKAMTVGRPRLAPDDVRELIAKKDKNEVAKSMIVFGKGSDIFNLRLGPYFAPKPAKLNGFTIPIPYFWMVSFKLSAVAFGPLLLFAIFAEMFLQPGKTVPPIPAIGVLVALSYAAYKWLKPFARQES